MSGVSNAPAMRRRELREVFPGPRSTWLKNAALNPVLSSQLSQADAEQLAALLDALADLDILTRHALPFSSSSIDHPAAGPNM